MGNWLDYVVCPRCDSALSQANAILRCDFCGSRYDIEGDIPRLVPDKKSRSEINIETYKKLAAVTPAGLARVHQEFDHAVSAVGLGINGATLEIGTGTGLLTEALLLHAKIDRVISTDVSMASAQYTKERLARFADTLDFVVCDGNRLPFRQGSFDLILGRSVLSHLLYYRTTLTEALKLLKPGGAAVFFEPVQTGKAYIAFMFRIILEFDNAAGSLGLTEDEKTRMGRSIKGMTKIISVSQDYETLAKLEDKYNFDIDVLCQEARDLGFASAQYVAAPNVDPTYFSYLRMHLRNSGVRPEIVEKLSWLKSAFGDTIGGTAGRKLTAPMGYFVFVKASLPARPVVRPQSTVTHPQTAPSPG